MEYDREEAGEIIVEQAKEIEELKDRIDKAIEYIGIDKDILSSCGIYDVNGIEVYKILKGSDKE